MYETKLEYVSGEKHYDIDDIGGMTWRDSQGIIRECDEQDMPTSRTGLDSDRVRDQSRWKRRKGDRANKAQQCEEPRS